MDFEGLENNRAEAIRASLKSMIEILEDKNTTPEQKIAAAKVVDAISDSHIKAYLLSNELGTVEKTGNKLMKQLDKLTGEKEQ